LNPQLDFFFQAVFAATAATIVSGAVAGRMKFNAYLIFTVVLTGIIYPISGSWKWGGGWLDAMGFYDFAGSILVHAVGGFAGLAGAIVLGPRMGRFVGGNTQGLPGHNLTFAALGTFILFVGWFGFNPGSQLAMQGAGNTDAVAIIATNTALAACAGAIVSLIVIWVMSGTPKLSMALNGMLGGLVGITANCDSVSNGSALIIGAVAGALVVFACIALEKLKIDDTVGAFPVHGVCGVWGGIATGIFGGHPIGAQITGSIVVPLYAFFTMLALFLALKAAGCLRVTDEHETKGLDAHEHGEGAYGSIS
jgi:Amt family ammonium transporter